ncbi:MAG: hypothetical protein ACUVXJ_18065 [Phycisphaerae bacterium]
MVVTAGFADHPPPSNVPPAPRLVVEIASNEPGSDVVCNTGDELTFLLYVENNGDRGATDVQVVISLPENARLADLQVILTIGPVGAGETVVIETVLRATASGRGVIAPVVSCAKLPESTPAGRPATFEVRTGGNVNQSRSRSATGCGLFGTAPALTFPGLYLLYHRRRGNECVRWCSPARLAKYR